MSQRALTSQSSSRLLGQTPARQALAQCGLVTKTERIREGDDFSVGSLGEVSSENWIVARLYVCCIVIVMRVGVEKHDVPDGDRSPQSCRGHVPERRALGWPAPHGDGLVQKHRGFDALLGVPP